MANRYQEDIKLIVGVEGSKTGNIPVHTAKDKIKGQRGIVYFNADGSSSSTTGNTPGTDEDGTKQEGTTQPDAGGADAGTSGGRSNAGNTTTDAGLSDPYPVDDATQPGSGIFAVDKMGLGDVVKGLSGLIDCATGNPVDVRFDGQFTAPDGWDDADSPPLDPDFTPGYFWAQTTVWANRNYVSYTAAGSWEEYKESLISAGHSVTDISIYTSSSTARTYAYKRDGWNKSYSTSRFLCSGEQWPPAVCSMAPYLTEWPSDKPMQLSYNLETGKYETHRMDGNVTTAYSQPVNQFSLCNLNGDPIKSFAQAGGGQAIYNETTGIATFVDANGKVTGFGDGAAVTNNQPR